MGHYFLPHHNPPPDTTMAQFSKISRATTFAGEGSSASVARSDGFKPLKGEGRKVQV